MNSTSLSNKPNIYFFNCGVMSVMLLLLLIIQSSVSHKSEPKKLLIISFDGFRWDYLDKVTGKIPNFDKFKAMGGYARKGSKSAFSTVTATNHYTIATGLYAESHGIIGNHIHDPRFNDTYSLFNLSQQYESKWFDNGGVPIWVTNQLQSSQHRTGSILWPGSSAEVGGVLPTRFIQPHQVYYHNADSFTFHSRVNTMINWFLSQYPINLGLLYFEEPDDTGHKHGPDSQEVIDKLIELDGVLGYLLDELVKHKLDDDINIIVTADHGMSAAPEEKRIVLDDYVDPNDFQVYGVNPVCNILPNDGKKESIYKKFKTAAESKGGFDVYYKEEIPVEYHFKDNDRVYPIVLIAHDHHTFAYNMTVQRNFSIGEHGYNNSLQDMHAIFMVKGPSFEVGASIETVNHVDIYGLMCHLLDLKPAPNNGSLDLVQDLLKEGDENTVVTFATYIGILVFIALVAGVFTMAACRQHRHMKRKQRQMTLPGGVQFSTLIQRESKVPLLSESDDDSL